MKRTKIKIIVLGLAALLASTGLKAEAVDAEAQQAQIEDIRSTLGNLSAQINEMKTKSDLGVSFGINGDLRYDYQEYSTASMAGGSAPANGVYYVTAPITDSTVHNGYTGVYAKRIEVEFKGKTASWAQWHLQFDFAGLKLEDLGVELNDLALIPFMENSGWTWNIKIGQFRQPFGIEQQTGSSSTPFPERAMMFGGANPVGLGKLVAERVMGLHAWQQKDFGPVGYKLQIAVANNATEDQVSGQTSLKTGFPAQYTDTAPSEFGRLGIDLNFIPQVKLNLGGSIIHNSANTTAFNPTSAQEFWYDVYGGDATLEIPKLNWKIWGELVESNKLTGIALGGPALTDLLVHAEGWYFTTVMQPLKFFMKDAPTVEINARLENYRPNVDADYSLTPWRYSSEQACSIGVKWSYIGKNYTSINYTTYGVNGDFSALNGTSLLVLQQQFNY